MLVLEDYQLVCWCGRKLTGKSAESRGSTGAGGRSLVPVSVVVQSAKIDGRYASFTLTFTISHR